MSMVEDQEKEFQEAVHRAKEAAAVLDEELQKDEADWEQKHESLRNGTSGEDNSHNSLFSQERTWPKLEPEALHGVVGDIAETIGPHTEADIVTLVAHTLSEFSAIIGRSAYTEIDGNQSPLVFWPVLVGATAKARKGSGENRIKRLFKQSILRGFVVNIAEASQAVKGWYMRSAIPK